ncbi:MAG: molybdenum cofactor biosynthesis protein MoaB [Gemmatimonadota bacterium]|jgi:molybdenum cofactor biosynthesis protein B|nr:molybdenum cofactor biosynthesis protein MoaB [Gemmatimonadota bacterium]
MTTDSHQQAASGTPVTVAIITVSDTRTPETDLNGRYLREKLEAAGHTVGIQRIVPDDPERVVSALEEVVADGTHRVALFNGGTGISSRDNTFDALSGKFEKTLPGFGELFRMLSWRQVGSAAMLSRATAGVCHNVFVVSMPGSPNAVQLAWEELLAPELAHLAFHLTTP